MPHVIALSGSLRRGSYNTALVRAAAELAPADLTIDLASIREIPLYDADLDQPGGQPPAVTELKQRIARADGLLLATPEYNYGVPGVLKNTIDWLSRPAADIPRVFGGLPTGLVGASGGPSGTRLGQAAWLPTLRALQVLLFTATGVLVAHAPRVFDAEGRLTDDATREVVRDYLARFAHFVTAHRRSP